MAAGGFREFVAGETLDEDAINDFLMQGVLVFAGTAARGSAITAPVEGQFSFLNDSDTVEFYDGSAWVALTPSTIDVQYLVVAGGGGGGRDARGGGGGAGGHRAGTATIVPGTHALIVGAGGAAHNQGVPSTFASVQSSGGGFGGIGGNRSISGGSGGSGGGGGSFEVSARAGGAGAFGAGGGGGANAVGATGSGGAGGAGGAGVSNSITGSSVTRAGGGGGGGDTSGGAGGAGGGGAGATSGTGGAGVANTGGGGGGGATGGAGGSGVIILRLPTARTVSFSGGVTQSSTTVGSDTVYTITATSTIEETVTIS